MCAHMDLVQCAVIHTACMVYTVFNGTLDAIVFVLVHHHIFTTLFRDDISMNRSKFSIPENFSFQSITVSR